MTGGQGEHHLIKATVNATPGSRRKSRGSQGFKGELWGVPSDQRGHLMSTPVKVIMRVQGGQWERPVGPRGSMGRLGDQGRQGKSLMGLLMIYKAHMLIYNYK